jgi:plastocyanin
MRSWRRLSGGILGSALAVLVFSSPALAANTNVAAAGNAITGGLAFAPPAVDVNVGDTVTWTNTDFLVPHTVTEDHGLFNLGGTFGVPPIVPLGFGPGEKVSRAFDAGTFHYFCEVHPVQMHGVVAAAMRLSSQPATRIRVKKKRRHGKLRKRKVRVRFNQITAVWGTVQLPSGQVFDVQMKQGGDWKTVRDGVTGLSGRFDGRKSGTASSFRARVRRDTDPGSASDWSPVASITP